MVADCGERGCLVGRRRRVEFASLFAFQALGVEVPCGSCTLVRPVAVEWVGSEWRRRFLGRREK